MISIDLYSWVGWHGFWVHFHPLDPLDAFLGHLASLNNACHLCCNASVADIRLAGFTHVPFAVIFILACLKLM